MRTEEPNLKNIYKKQSNIYNISMGYIYVLKNKINGKMYIGKTINIIKRFTGHKNSGNKANIPICNAIKQYTFDGFDKYIYSGITNNILNEIETELILRLNTLSPN